MSGRYRPRIAVLLVLGALGCGESAPVDPRTNPNDGPPTGNGDGSCSVPGEALAEDVSTPDTIIGDGTPASCTSGAFVDAVARGGVITFDCGPEPIIITLDRTAKVFNDQNPDVVIDGGGRVTLSGGGRVRILYQNTCDQEQVWTTSHCNDQDHPRLTVQNVTFVDGNAKAEEDGGGAIFVRGGRFKAVNTRFFNNVCHDVGPDVGRRGDSGVRPVPGPAGVRREQHLWRGRARECLLERWGAQLDRRFVHASSTAPSRTTRRSATAPIRSGAGPRAAGAAAPSTTTAIRSRSPSAAP